MNISVLKITFIVVTSLLWSSASAFTMRIPQNFSPAYVPASPTNGVASFRPHYRPPPQIQGRQQRMASRYPQWRQRFAPAKRVVAPWPFPVSYRPVRSPGISYNHPMPYRPYSRGFYRPAAHQSGYLRQPMPYQPAYTRASPQYLPGRGVNMANQFRRNSPYPSGYPRNYANFRPRPAAPAWGYYQQQAFVNSGQGRYAVTPYRFRPIAQSRRYVPGYFVPQRGTSYPPVATNYPTPRGWTGSQWRQPAGSYGEADYRYGQAAYRFRPDPRFSYRRLPAATPSGFDPYSRRDQATRGGSPQANIRNYQTSTGRTPQAAYRAGEVGGNSRVAYR
ncbi:MAG: hypothetical protein ABW185_14540 [Sedimenticola sp.]